MARLLPVCLAVVTLAVLAQQAAAYPTLWATKYASTCTAHPQKGYAAHKPPSMDNGITFVVKGAGLCAGKKNTVTVKFPEARRAYLTSTVGTFDKATPKCPNAIVLDKTNGFATGDMYTATIMIPATAKGTVDMKVTSAAGPAAAYRQNSIKAKVVKC